jgi:drug/metabolite transporter (DMT)-like permease
MPASRAAAGGVALILVASVLFGICGSLGKVGIQAGLSPVQVTWLRVFGVGVIAIAIALPVLRRLGQRPPWGGLILFGLTAIAGVQAF